MNWEKLAKERGEDIIALTQTIEDKRALIHGLVECMTWRETTKIRPEPFRFVIAFVPIGGAWQMHVALLCSPQDQYQSDSWKTIDGRSIPEPSHWMNLPHPPPPEFNVLV